MRVLNSLVAAFSTYSRIPMPRIEWTDENRRYAMCFFPMVGVAVGLALAAWLWLCEELALPSLLRGAVGAVVPLLVTGGIHMDGFMDTADALASWQPMEKRLEILKDSHTGAFAVMACAGYLLVTAGLLGAARLRDAPLLGACFVLSRALSAWALVSFKSARPGGMLDGFSRAAEKRRASVCAVIYTALCALLWALLDPWTAPLCLAAAAVCLLGYRRVSYKYFGGVTGDLAGWFLQLAELACIAAVVIGGRL